MSQEDASTQDAPEATPAPESKDESTPAVTGDKTFDAAYVAELRKEAAKYRTEAQEAKGKLSEREEAEQSNLEKAQTKLAKAEQKAAENENALLRFTVANEKKVPADAVEFLRGSSREDL